MGVWTTPTITQNTWSTPSGPTSEPTQVAGSPIGLLLCLTYATDSQGVQIPPVWTQVIDNTSVWS